MQNQFAEINRLIENGDLTKAFDKATGIADVNKAYFNELKNSRSLRVSDRDSDK